jgi:uncharacterized phage-associated protein
MTKTFTYDDVVRYVYEETSDEENYLIEEALVEDSSLLMYYLDIADIKEGLNKVMRSPRQSSINTILTYSRSVPSQSNAYIY